MVQSALLFGVCASTFVSSSNAQPVASVPGLVDAATVIADLQVELIYATPENFAGRVLYSDLRQCFLQEDAARMLAEAQKKLRAAHNDLRLRVYDCARPRSVQVQMWEAVKGTPQQGYVANPHGATGSIHNYGCAVDLTLAHPDGTPLDMGTPFDHFGTAAQPRSELSLLKKGKLTHVQVANRLILREVMVRAGFFPLSHEWWHFNCASAAEVRRRYKIIP